MVVDGYGQFGGGPSLKDSTHQRPGQNIHPVVHFTEPQDFQGRKKTFCQELQISKGAINAQVHLSWTCAISYDQSSGHLQRLLIYGNNNWLVFDLACSLDFLLSSSSLILPIANIHIRCLNTFRSCFTSQNWQIWMTSKFLLTDPAMLQTGDSHAPHPI